MKKLKLTFKGFSRPTKDPPIIMITPEQLDDAINQGICLISEEVRPQTTNDEHYLIGQVVSHFATFIKFELQKEGIKNVTGNK